MVDEDPLLDAFERGELGPSEFPHERHVRVAWALAQRYDAGTALERLAAGLHRLLERAGHPGAYHETITRAWFELIRQSEGPDRDPFLLDKGLLGRYYSAARLAAGRHDWLEPDLHPLRLPPPAG